MLALLQGFGLLLMHNWVVSLKTAGAYYSIIWPLYVVIVLLPLSLMMLASEPRIKYKPVIMFVAIAAICASFMGGMTWVAGISRYEMDKHVWVFGLCVTGAWFIGLAFLGHYCMYQTWATHYVALFNIAWRNAVKMLTAGIFVGLFWAALALLVALFKILGVQFFDTLIFNRHFVYPATALSFSLGLSLYAAREEALAEFKRATLQVLGWLLPLVSLILLAFVLTLPFKGINTLWATGYATGLMLGLLGLMVFLTNAAFQDGTEFKYPTWVLRMTNVGLLSMPIYIALCSYAMFLRVHQYGWTNDRVWAASLVFVMAIYGFGYALAAFKTLQMPSARLQYIKTSNIVAALSVIVLAILLNSPILNPMRIGVSSQIARLNSHQISAASFDYQYLRFDGGSYGDTALKALIADTQSTNAAIIKPLAQAALKADFRSWVGQPVKEGLYELAHLKQNIQMYPLGSVVDDAFYMALSAELKSHNLYLNCIDQNMAETKKNGCSGLLVDLNQDKATEVVVFDSYSHRVFQFKRNQWQYIGDLQKENYQNNTTVSDAQSLKLGDVKTEQPKWQTLIVGKSQYRLEQRNCCAEALEDVK